MDDIQAEADRLIGLDQSGREREMVVIALRLGQKAQGSWETLRAMDREVIDDLTSGRAGHGSPFEAEE